MSFYLKENNVDNTSTAVDCSHQNELAKRPHNFLKEQLVAFKEDRTPVLRPVGMKKYEK